MKKIITISLVFLIAAFKSNAQTGVNTRNPDASANMEISSSNKGLLIPRLSIADITVKTPVAVAPKDGLLIYNTNTVTKKTLFHWDALANSGAGNWNSHLFFKETPKTAVIGMAGSNFAALDNLNPGASTLINNSNGNTLVIQSSGYMPNLDVVNNSTNGLTVNLGSGVYMIEISFLITAPVPDSGRGSVLTGSNYYNMGYYTDIKTSIDATGTVTNSARVERAVLSQANQNHRVTFNTTFTLPDNVTNPVSSLTVALGRRSGSSHNDLVYIIPSGSYYKLTKLK
ncbi:hypothetical protein NJT12_24280 [Flavobacterium sp. AC]|uniref:Uncharacterized protein n=1 Tax=Flavobacterium azizsancarii TaxID=2961580 RepID=A0ABT4WLK4_9FLAO|nr:hypothetical protein [Flavobacterium azizsancarii]MDA6072745.1 hypothetical protein [Flavobacterium azizsancarii]